MTFLSTLRLPQLAALLLISLAIAGCSGARDADRETLVATSTTIIADVASAIAGDDMAVRALIPRGTSPHGYEPTPRDAAMLSDADLVVLNGLGLESGLNSLFDGTVQPEALLILADSLPDTLREGLAVRGHGGSDRRADAHEGHDHGPTDPHVWLDPMAVMHWTFALEDQFALMDSVHVESYRRRGANYRDSLLALDAWIRAQVAAIPPERRLLVTDHRMAGAFARRYGFTTLGSVMPGFSTLASPSARELTRLESLMSERSVQALFTGEETPSAVAKRVADDLGVRLVSLRVASLGPRGSGEDSYILAMRANVRRIVRALAPPSSNP